MSAIDESRQRYSEGADRLRRAAAGLTAADLDAVPVPGTWSIRQIILHLGDSELVYVDRMKRVAAEDTPLLVAYDENKFAARLDGGTQNVDTAVELVAVVRRHMIEVLAGLPAAAFDRKGVHTERGLLSLADLLGSAGKHLEHHLGFLLKKRALLGKPVTL